MDPQLTKDPSLAPKLFKDLVRERYLISKHTNTSYQDTASLTQIERQYIFEFITDDLNREREAYEKLRQEQSQ